MTQDETADDRGADDGGIERVQSLVPGLDAILCGGFLRGGLYMIEGSPGAGKTVLASQILYNQAARGSRALFVTVLGESHGRMMSHLAAMRFLDRSLVPHQLAYISAYQALEEGGLKGLGILILREVRARGATLLVLDGMSAVAEKSGGGFELKEFTHELQTLASATNCTMFLLTTPPSATSAPEHTMVDGLLELRQRPYGVRNERRLVVHKIRGSAYLEGEHAYNITTEGVTVFPRLEAQFAVPTRGKAAARLRLSTGIASLDAMLGGGIPAATTAALVGPTGAGKTVLGLQFLSCSTAAEPGLLVGCYEPPERLLLKATTMGLDMVDAAQRGDLDFLWFPVGESILDQMAHRLLDAVRQRSVKRLVIDGISGFEHSALDPERFARFWSALANELRSQGVTTLITVELQDLAGPAVRLPMSWMSSLAEAMIVVRYVEVRSRLHRLISLLKVRDSAFDPTIREFEITDSGIIVGQPFEGVEAVLSGTAREAGQQPPRSG